MGGEGGEVRGPAPAGPGDGRAQHSGSALLRGWLSSGLTLVVGFGTGLEVSLHPGR